MNASKMMSLVLMLAMAPPLAVLPGQTEKQPGKVADIRVASGTVVLDVVVTDKKNKVVTDLRPEDFRVYEDDILQKLDSFEVRAAGTLKSGEQQTTAPRPSYLMFLFDFSTTEFENQKLVREAGARFIQQSLEPGDYVAVFYNGTDFRVLSGFTNDKTLLATVVGQQDIGGLSRSQMGAIAASGVGGTADSGSVSVQSINRALAALGATAGLADAAGQGITARVDSDLSFMRSSVAQRTAWGVISAVEAISRAVSPLQGRKTLVLFSQGFLVSDFHLERKLQDIISTANQSNVAIYTVDSGGLATSLAGGDRLSGISAQTGSSRIEAHGGDSVFDSARTVGGDSRELSLRYLAAATGGLAFRNTNDLSVSLGRVAQDMRSHYLLSYRPLNQNFDGKFRKIRVETAPKGFSVRTRSGYTASAPAAAPVTAAESELIAAARNIGDATLPFDVALAQFPVSPQRARVPVTVEIPTRELSFVQSGDKLTASLLIVGLLRNQAGEIVTRVGTPVQVSATKEEYKVLEKGSVSFTNAIDVPPGQYAFEAFIRDQSSGKAAVRDYSLQVAPLGDKLAASSIVLSTQVDPLKIGEQQGILTLGSARVLPSARRQFRNGDNLVYLFNVYNFAASDQQKPNLEVRVTVERPGAQPLKLPPYRLDQLDTDEIPHVTVARYVSLNGLPVGRHYLVAEVEDLNSGQTCRARTSMEIVP